jgi:murein DD-endopeptidase
MRSAFLWFVLLLTVCAGAQQLQDIPVEVRVPVSPTPVRAGGMTHLFYEIHLTNLRSPRVRLEKVEVLDQSGQIRLVLRDQELVADLWRPGLAPPGDKRDIDGGMTAVVFLEIIASPNAVPTWLKNRLTFSSSAKTGFIDVSVPVALRPAPIISPPLKGKGWVALSGLSNSNSHRRTIVTVNGSATIAQRFATDWTRVGDGGTAFHDDPAKNSNWAPYGAEVLAVGDGVVTDLKDGIPENDPTSDHKAVPIDLTTVAGNYVILRLGGGVYALYAHLRPGSIRVKIGQRVRMGRTIAQLGNSGQADAPHLHFHLMDRNSPLGAEGIPYVFNDYSLEGVLSSKQFLISGGWHPAGRPIRKRREEPSENDVVDFPE